ncbi:ATP-dependent nuclease [Haloarchaeobius sp. DFWS5]|uniref:ATP-dependent nuclease n=1 Tax=Haloarchaeobius sp. DFWS5 TaxID=3446114 RepID=UPI003EB72ED5
MELKQWETRNYKSIKSGESIDFGNINVLVGKNNTGKSSVIDAIRDYREAFIVGNSVNAEWINKRVTRDGDAQQLEFCFTFRLDDKERESLFQDLIETDQISERQKDLWDEDTFREITHELKLKPSFGRRSEISGESNMYSEFEGNRVKLREGDLDDEEVSYLNFNTLANIEYDGERIDWVPVKKLFESTLDSWEFIDAFRRPENEKDAVERDDLDEGGDNLSQVLLTLAANNYKQFRKVSDTYSNVMENIDSVKSPLRGDQTTVEIKEKGFSGSFDLSEISAGSKEVLTLITQIVLANEGCNMVFVEEPEIHLHPGAQREIFNLILEELGSLDGPQVVLSTHSSVFVDHERADTIISVKRDGPTTLSQSEEDDINNDLKDLGYRFSGMLRCDAIVIVEGTSDKTILKTVAEHYGFNFEENRIGVADMDNSVTLVKHSRSLVKILSVFSIPYLFICDSDLTEHLPNYDVSGDDDHLAPIAIEGKIRDYINRADDGEVWWEEADEDQVYVWREEEIEAYLLSDREAVINWSAVDEDTIDGILDNEELDPDEKLEEICREKRPHLSEDLDSFIKPTDTSDLASRVGLDRIPGEFHNVMIRIGELVGEGETIEERIPE